MFTDLTTGAALRRRIRALDPEREDEQITRLVSDVLYGDPYFAHSTFLVTFARQAAVPAIAKVLARSGQGDVVADPRRRNNDTIVFFTEFFRRGYRSEAGRAAIARMEAIHGNFRIDDELKVYTLATVIFEPERLATQFGCEPFSRVEKLGRWNFWKGFANAMPIELPTYDREQFIDWMIDYERRNYAHTTDAELIFDGLVRDWARWYPNWMGGQSLARNSLAALLDDHTRQAMGQPNPSRSMQLRVKLTAQAYLKTVPVHVIRENRSIVDYFGRDHNDPSDLGEVGYKPRRYNPRGSSSA